MRQHRARLRRVGRARAPVHVIWIGSTGRIEPPASSPDDYSRRATVGKQTRKKGEASQAPYWRRCPQEARDRDGPPKGNRSAARSVQRVKQSGLQGLQELQHRGVHLRGTLLLCPVAAARQHHAVPQRRHELRKIQDELIHAANSGDSFWLLRYFWSLRLTSLRQWKLIEPLDLAQGTGRISP